MCSTGTRRNRADTYTYDADEEPDLFLADDDEAEDEDEGDGGDGCDYGDKYGHEGDEEECGSKSCRPTPSPYGFGDASVRGGNISTDYKTVHSSNDFDYDFDFDHDYGINGCQGSIPPSVADVVSWSTDGTVKFWDCKTSVGSITSALKTLYSPNYKMYCCAPFEMGEISEIGSSLVQPLWLPTESKELTDASGPVVSQSPSLTQSAQRGERGEKAQRGSLLLCGGEECAAMSTTGVVGDSLATGQKSVESVASQPRPSSSRFVSFLGNPVYCIQY